MLASLTRRDADRIEEKRAGAAGRTPGNAGAVAVVAATAAEARAAAAGLGSRVSGCAVRPEAFAAYLADLGAPARVILCATRGSARRGAAFLLRASARLLWPPPPTDIEAAIGGLRDRETTPGSRRPARPVRSERRPGRLPSALLLEGLVDRTRSRAALTAVAEGGPHDWVVESARHVRLRDRSLADLARAGVRWSTLEPVELVAIYAAREVALSLRRRAELPRGTPVWIRTGPARR